MRPPNVSTEMFRDCKLCLRAVGFKREDGSARSLHQFSGFFHQLSFSHFLYFLDNIDDHVQIFGHPAVVSKFFKSQYENEADWIFRFELIFRGLRNFFFSRINESSKPRHHQRDSTHKLNPQRSFFLISAQFILLLWMCVTVEDQVFVY